MELSAITNVRIVTNKLHVPQEKKFAPSTIYIEEGKIQAIKPGVLLEPDESILDANGKLISPGYIDLQINGGFGKDFTTEPNSIWEVGTQLLKFGITSFLPTIISSPLENIEEALRVIQNGPPKKYRGSNVLGLHLEGPFLNPIKKGAHNIDYFLSATDHRIFETINFSNGIRLVTLAPELEGAEQLIIKLRQQGVIISAGHTDANYEQAQKGLKAGITMGTHLFNAMRALGHTDPGIVGALLEDQNAFVGLIADGIHVHPSIVASTMLLKKNKLILVSDAMSALGMPPGIYPQIDEEVHVDRNCARLANGTLAGSILKMDEAVRNLIDFSNCSLIDAISTVTSNPALGIGELNKGHIDIGFDADFVLLDEFLHPQATIVSGKLLWSL